jgi:hypothetical protein
MVGARCGQGIFAATYSELTARLTGGGQQAVMLRCMSVCRQSGVSVVWWVDASER